MGGNMTDTDLSFAVAGGGCTGCGACAKGGCGSLTALDTFVVAEGERSLISGSGPRLGKAFVRVLGRQLDRFVEFEFILNDETLSVELVMPDAAFAEFCERCEAEILPDENGEIVSLEAIKARTAGLYRAAPAGRG
ncbi:hypothetical protein FF124_14875 [Martelella lutilitoris]|uniref:Uncharacterized protein n=2 Tax=Martelella lutilitoris TaxID=2583532 RepID=A0A5C4JND2_9HYPH|nr:hypothetical protein FF124_14875 [Martelella lutilitoris]